jgi:hypothetical protein
MPLQYSAGEIFILETSFGGGFDYPEFVRKHVALKAEVDLNIPHLMERYGEWLVRTGKSATALLIEHHFGKDYSDNIDGDGFIAWMAAQGVIEILTSNVVKVAVDAYEGGDVRLSADDGKGDVWKQVMDDPAPKLEQVSWREIVPRATPAEPEPDSPFLVAAVSINLAIKRSLDFGCDLEEAVVAQIVKQQFPDRPDWQDQHSYMITAIQSDGEEDRSKTVRIEIKEPAAYQGLYSVQISRYVRKGVESFGFHGTRYRQSSLEATKLSLLVLSGSILPVDVKNIYDIHSAEQPLVVYNGEHTWFEELRVGRVSNADIVRSKVTGELGLMVLEPVEEYDLADFHALPTYQKFREEWNIPVHLIEGWPGSDGAYVGAFLSRDRLAELQAIVWGVHCLQGDIRHRIEARRP